MPLGGNIDEPRSPRVGPWERMGYGLGDAACNIVLQFVFTFMPFFYTDVFGLDAAAMGTMFLVVRGVSALADPVMGALCDRTHTRWGKFRPYLLAMSVPFAAAAVLVFTTPNLSADGKLAYAYATYLALMTAYSAVNVPYCSLGAAITRDPQERVELNGFRYFLVTGVGVLSSYAVLPMVAWLGGGDDRTGFSRTMMVLASLAAAMLVACFALTRERAVDAPSARSDLREDVRALVRNDQWRVVTAINFVLFVALVVQDGLVVGYMTWYAGRKDLVPTFVAVGLVSAMLGAACAGPLTRRMDKGRAYAWLQAAIVAALASLWTLKPGNVAAMFACYAAVEFFAKTASVILWSMMADAVDYGEVVTGRRIVGLALAGSLLALKLGTAVGGAMLGWMLAMVGYESKATSQPTQAVAGIVALFTLVPALGHAALIALVSRWRLDNARCEAVRAALEGRQAGESPQRSIAVGDASQM